MCLRDKRTRVFCWLHNVSKSRKGCKGTAWESSKLRRKTIVCRSDRHLSNHSLINDILPVVRRHTPILPAVWLKSAWLECPLTESRRRSRFAAVITGMTFAFSDQFRVGEGAGTYALLGVFLHSDRHLIPLSVAESIQIRASGIRRRWQMSKVISLRTPKMNWRKALSGLAVCAACAGTLISQLHRIDAQELTEVVASATSLPAGIISVAVLESVSATDPASQGDADVVTQLLADIAAARSSAAELSSYTAVLEMQEEVDNTLRPLDRIQIKVRREPFSVYMHWDDTGQEVLFADGHNNNRLLVKPTKGLAVLKRLWRLEPNCRMAKQSCRYPITASGIENLAARIQEFYAVRDDWSVVAACSISDATVAESEVRAYEIRFQNKEVSSEYLGSRFCFDKATGLLISVDNYGWSDTGQPRLIEHYVYHSINSAKDLQDEDFVETNSEYGFVAR